MLPLAPGFVYCQFPCNFRAVNGATLWTPSPETMRHRGLIANGPHCERQLNRSRVAAPRCGWGTALRCSLPRICHFVSDDPNARKGTRSERSNDRHVGGIASACHQNASDTRRIVARVKRVPAAEIDLKPGTEIHGFRFRRHANVAEITGAVTRRNVHATAKGDRQMREVPANAPTFDMCLPCCLGWVCAHTRT